MGVLDIYGFEILEVRLIATLFYVCVCPFMLDVVDTKNLFLQ